MRTVLGDNRNKKVINGDYYELGSGTSGGYRKHEDVSVHCHHPQPDTNPNPESPTLNNPYPSTPLKSKFPNSCKQILQKEQVNSIHEEDPHEETRPKQSIAMEMYKNSKMRRSSQNQASPKKGILKHSMMDKKEQEDRDSLRDRVGLKIKVDRSVTIDNNAEIKEKRSINNSEMPIEMDKSHLSQTARVSGQRYERNSNEIVHRQNTQHTEGKETVAIVTGRLREASSDEATEDRYGHFEATVLEEIEFLKERLQYLEKELHESEQRMKDYDLQREHSKAKQEIELLKKQNELLKKFHSEYPQKSNQTTLDLESALKLMENKSTAIITFLVMLLFCVLVGKSGSGNSCAK